MKPDKAVKTVTVGGGAAGSVVQGPRTAVLMGGTGERSGVMMGSEVDLDRVAASMERHAPDTASVTSHSSQPGAKQLGRSIAGALTGVAANFKSKLVNMGAGSQLVSRSSPSPPDIRSSVSDHRSSDHSGRMVASTGAKVREVPIRLEQSSTGGSSVSPHVIPLTVPGAEYGQYSYQKPMRLNPFMYLMHCTVKINPTFVSRLFSKR